MEKEEILDYLQSEDERVANGKTVTALYLNDGSKTYTYFIKKRQTAEL